MIPILRVVSGICNLIYFSAKGYGGDNCPLKDDQTQQIVGLDRNEAGEGYVGQTCKFAGEEEEYVLGVLIGAYALAIFISYFMLQLTNRWGYEEFSEECEQVFGHFVGFRWIGIMSKQFNYGLTFLDFFTRHSMGIATFGTVYYGNAYYGLTAGSEQPKPSSPPHAAGAQNLWMDIWGPKGTNWKNITAADVLKEKCFMMDRALCLPNSTLAHSVTALKPNGTNCEFDAASSIPHCSVSESVTPIAPVYYYEDNAHWHELGDRFQNAIWVMLIGAGLLIVMTALVRAVRKVVHIYRAPAANAELQQPLREKMLQEMEEEDERKAREREAVHEFQAVIADGFGMAAGLFWYACFYWLLLWVLELLDPRGSSDWTELGDGIGGSNALGQYGPSSRSLYFVAVFLWAYMMELGLWCSKLVRFVLHWLQQELDLLCHIGIDPGTCSRKGCLNRWFGWKKNHINVAEIDKMNPVILTWAFGYLLFNLLRILVFNLLLNSSDQFKAWCEYGWTVRTPTYPSDYKDFSNIIDSSVTSALGFCVLMHAICLPIVAYGLHQSEVLKHDRRILRKMEGVFAIHMNQTVCYTHESDWTVCYTHEYLHLNT